MPIEGTVIPAIEIRNELTHFALSEQTQQDIFFVKSKGDKTAATAIHSLCFISNVAFGGLVLHFSGFTVVAKNRCLASIKIDMVVAYFFSILHIKSRN